MKQTAGVQERGEVMERPGEKVICLLWRAKGSSLSTKGLRDSGTHTMYSTYELGTTGHTNDCFLVHGEIRVEYIHLQTDASDSPNAFSPACSPALWRWAASFPPVRRFCVQQGAAVGAPRDVKITDGTVR